MINYDQSLHHPNLLCYGIQYNLADNFLLRDLDLLLIDSLVDDKHNTLLGYLCNHLYDKLRKLLIRDFRLTENYLYYDQMLHFPNQKYYDTKYNQLEIVN